MDNKIPELTLSPDLEKIPELTFAPAVSEAPLVVQENKENAEAKLDMSRLSPAEQNAVKEFSQKIDIKDSNLVLQYGAGAQKSIADFSSGALERVRTKDMGEVGDMVSHLVVELKGFDAFEEQKGIIGFFKKQLNQLEGLRTRYAKVETNVNTITEQLEGHQLTLLKDIATLDQMYEKNLEYYKQLSMYIIAGKLKLEEVRAGELAELRKKAQLSALPEDAQAANDLANLCSHFEKKLYDLELTRVISIQMAPQIRLIQNNDKLMAEKIQSSIVNTIPLWKSQMVLALGLYHSKQAMEAQREVTDMTNELLRKNAEALKIGTIETAKESERAIVDIETLKNTNASLITTLDEVLKIQQEGAQKRREAEVELGRIEGELKQKLLEIRG